MDFGHMLDVAISLAFMYLMLSLFCTIITEYIAGIMKMRAKNLREGLKELAGDSPFFYQILAHPLIRAAAPQKDKLEEDAKFKKALAAAADHVKTAQAAVGVRGTHDPAKSNALAAAQTAEAKLKGLVNGTDGAASKAVAPVAAKADPSYLSSQAFADAVLDSLNPNVHLDDTSTYKAILDGIAHVPDQRMRDTLRAILNNATGNLESARDAIAHWFDTEMERLEGLYKKKAQAISVIVGLFLAVLTNADTIHVARVLWLDQGGMAARIADTAVEAVNQKTMIDMAEADRKMLQAGQALDAAEDELARTPGKDAQTKRDDAKKAQETAEAARAKVVDDSKANLASLRATLTPLPIGWSDDNPSRITTFGDFVLRLLGWIMTALALSLGASFWFDTLNKFMNIRFAGPKPSTKAAPTKQT